MDNFDDVARQLTALGGELEQLTDAELTELGHLATSLIVTRTKHGEDVEGKPFAPYTPEYAEERAKRGLERKPDLAVTGHMLGAILPGVTGPGEVTIRFASPFEATKAAANNFGYSGNALVRSHSRGAFVNNKGQRVSRDEVARDRRRKKSRLTQRTENVDAHKRSTNRPAREFFDIRQPREIDMLGEAIGKSIAVRFEKKVIR